MEKGQLSIHSENLLPIIKKWLYADKDIFVRELISNACDAVAKQQKLVEMGEAQEERYQVRVTIDKTRKTLTFSDNGIGMSADEVKKYINQVAFSGAQDFLEKYQNVDVIGHFGLGFYSAFMVSSEVAIETRADDNAPVFWRSDGSVEYEMDTGKRETRGTDIILSLLEEEEEYLEEFRLRSIIEKYAFFLPADIYLDVAGEEKQDEKPINNKEPLWRKPPRECKDEEYVEFYRTLFRQFDEPLFWIHLNVEHPFRLQGILYFPKLKQSMEGMEGQIKLYNNRVFVADNLKEVIPEFLLLLKGAIDCPDLPLNVSRSFLQNDGTVRLMQQHITKKVADRLKSLFEKERDKFVQYWPDIAPFVRFGCLRDEKFYDAVQDVLLYETIAGETMTLAEYRKAHGDKIAYVSDRVAQGYIAGVFKEKNLAAMLLDGPVDAHFISFIEQKSQGVSFSRIDADASHLKGDGEAMDKTALEKLMRDALGKENLEIEVSALSAEELPAMLLEDEFMRRFSDMSARFGGMPNPMEAKQTLLLNAANPLVKRLDALLKEEGGGDRARLIAENLYDLALLQHRPLTADETREYVARATRALSSIADA